MRLNSLESPPGARKDRRRVGRGIGSTLGKTSGKGHKGQHARAGGFRKVGFEGGQMPLQRRLPKVGFRSRIKPLVAQVRLGELVKLAGLDVTLDVLKAANVVAANAIRAKVIDSGEINVAVKLKGIVATKGATAKIEAVGGTIEA